MRTYIKRMANATENHCQTEASTAAFRSALSLPRNGRTAMSGTWRLITRGYAKINNNKKKAVRTNVRKYAFLTTLVLSLLTACLSCDLPSSAMLRSIHWVVVYRRSRDLCVPSSRITNSISRTARLLKMAPIDRPEAPLTIRTYVV